MNSLRDTNTGLIDFDIDAHTEYAIENICLFASDEETIHTVHSRMIFYKYARFSRRSSL